jgi:hypothetical protein
MNYSKARASIIVRNHAADPRYAPYCMRCNGLRRMVIVEPFYWRHSCGAEHDERACIVTASTGDAGRD